MELENIYIKEYYKYKRRTSKKSLSYNDWLNCLPLSYRQELDGKTNPINLQEIERLAFLKYRLSGKKSMNTFIFTQAKTNKLTDEEIETLLCNLNKRISKDLEKKAGTVKFTCNIF